MGLWSKLTGKKGAASSDGDAAAVGDGRTQPPATPALGKITRFDAADGVGEITLEDETRLRFGRSACKGLDPVLSAEVEVTAVGRHPLGGHRATMVIPRSGTLAELDQLHDLRAEQHGMVEATQAQAVASALGLGTVTILLRDVPGRGRAGVRGLFEAAGVLTRGTSLGFAPSPILSLEGRDLQVFVGYEPFPRERLDCRLCGDDFDLGSGFLSLSTGLADLDVGKRVMLGDTTPDEWAMEGGLRRLSRLALKLLALGTGVVVHRAGHVVQPARRWTRLLGDLDDSSSRPFGAWTDHGFSEDRRQLKVWGMSVSSHPDVAVEVADHESSDEFARAAGALLLACSRMVHENRLLSRGERIAVPRGVEVGPSPVSTSESADDPTTSIYEVADDGTTLRPVRVGESSALAWERANASREGAALRFAAYKEMFLAGLERPGKLVKVASMDFDDVPPGPPEHEVVVMQRDDGKFALVTCGLGRVAQPNGSVDDETAHIELMIVLSDHHPRIAEALSHLGRFLHGRGADAAPWGPEHRISFGEPIGPSASYALGFVGHVAFDHGPPITLLCPTVMTDEERRSVSSDEVSAWLAEHGNDDAVRDRWLALAGVA